MQLPPWLRDAIDEIAAEVPQRDLARAASELSDAYRSGDFSRAPLDSHARRVAYLAQRMPATYAACTRVFEEIQTLVPDFAPKGVLDLGAGPGTATLAASDCWFTIDSAALIERDAKIVELGKQLVASRNSGCRYTACRISTSWFSSDLPHVSEGHGFSRADNLQPEDPASAAEVRAPDLVTVSYALGELTATDQQSLVSQAWKNSAQLLVLIEPGTKRGFANILAARDALAPLGAHILAPCPRANAHPCPMAAANDWCHFSQRVERTSLHRTLKGGELGYEDEKFSYVVFSRTPLANAPARIVRHPDIRKGHIELQLCTAKGLERVTVGKSQKDRYRAARKAEWGDAFQI